MEIFWNTLPRYSVGLAPMDGITDVAMRQIQTEIAKPEVMYTEFVSAEGLARVPENFENELIYTEEQRPVVAQLFGVDEESFIEAVNILLEKKFDGIDINMGCPSKNITTKGGGAALIGNIKKSEKIVLRCYETINGRVPLSVKTRIGMSENIYEKWAEFLGNLPLQQITVHGRLYSQGHRGPVDWLSIKRMAKIFAKNEIVCFGNGNITSQIEGQKAAKKYHLDGVLIGQAVLGNPWVFSDKIPTIDERLQAMVRHSQLYVQYYPEKPFYNLYKHLAAYCKGFDNASEWRLKLMKANSVKDVSNITDMIRQSILVLGEENC